jgi:hypothetical protein
MRVFLFGFVMVVGIFSLLTQSLSVPFASMEAANEQLFLVGGADCEVTGKSQNSWCGTIANSQGVCPASKTYIDRPAGVAKTKLSDGQKLVCDGGGKENYCQSHEYTKTKSGPCDKIAQTPSESEIQIPNSNY